MIEISHIHIHHSPNNEDKENVVHSPNNKDIKRMRYHLELAVTVT